MRGHKFVTKFSVKGKLISGDGNCDTKSYPEGAVRRCSSNRASRSQIFFKTGILKNLLIFTVKHLCWSLLLISLYD